MDSNIPEIDMTRLKENELEVACVKLFSNLGWDAKLASDVSFGTRTLRPDIVLSDGLKDCGYVEVISSMKPESIWRKKEQIQFIIDKCKPAIFILTNGIVFDVFYDGKYSGSNSTPPSIHTFKTLYRGREYSNALKEHLNKKGD